MQWIDERESIRIGNKTYRHGDEVPLELIPTETVKKFKDKGQMGALPEKYDPKKHFSERVKELKAENMKLKAENIKLKTEIKDLKDEIEALKNPVKPDEKKEKSK